MFVVIAANCLGCVLQDIGQGLADQPPVAFDDDRFVRHVETIFDVRMADALKKNRLTQNLAEIDRLHCRHRHARK